MLQPAFTSTKISEDLKVTERKSVLVNQQCVVYEFKCSSCDANYIGHTSRHLHLRINEHRYSVTGKHLKEKHQQEPTNIQERFKILLKCRGTFECLIYRMSLIKEKRPSLTTQTDSIPAKLFVFLFFKFNVLYTFVWIGLGCWRTSLWDTIEVQEFSWQAEEEKKQMR